MSKLCFQHLANKRNPKESRSKWDIPSHCQPLRRCLPTGCECAYDSMDREVFFFVCFKYLKLIPFARLFHSCLNFAKRECQKNLTHITIWTFFPLYSAEPKKKLKANYTGETEYYLNIISSLSTYRII